MDYFLYYGLFDGSLRMPGKKVGGFRIYGSMTIGIHGTIANLVQERKNDVPFGRK